VLGLGELQTSSTECCRFPGGIVNISDDSNWGSYHDTCSFLVSPDLDESRVV